MDLLSELGDLGDIDMGKLLDEAFSVRAVVLICLHNSNNEAFSVRAVVCLFVCSIAEPPRCYHTTPHRAARLVLSCRSHRRPPAATPSPRNRHSRRRCRS